MNQDRPDETQLRSAALESARSIFLARQRAEEELVRAKDALAMQSERLRVTLASIGDAVVTTDTEGRILSLNRAAETLCGWAEAEARGHELGEVLRLVDEETRQPLENLAQRALREGSLVGLAGHTLIVARDGTETPIDDSAVPMRDDSAGVLGVVLVLRSIATTRRAELALRESEQELADFFENASVALHWVGPDGIVLRVNRAELALLGYAQDEYVGRHIAEFHVDRDVIADVLTRLSAGHMVKDQPARMLCRDGSIKHVLLDSSVMWRNGRFVHTRCFTRDVTDRKRAEEAQAALAAIVESSQDAIISKTLDSRIVSWNAGAEVLFGYTADEAVGRPIYLLIPPERQDEERMILDRLCRGERIEHYETVRVSKSGRRIDVSLTISPVRDASGQVVGASTIVRDMSARKRAERRLAAQHEVSQALADSSDLMDAAPKILRALCDSLDWQFAGLWLLDERGSVLRCAETFQARSVHLPRFEAATRNRVFERAVGLPGQVWAAGAPLWVADVTQDDNFPRLAIAASEGLHTGAGFPILLDDAVLGVMDFFSVEVRDRDEGVVQVFSAIGSQLGQFIERKRAEAALRASEGRFRFLADAVPPIIWTAAPDGTVTYANKRCFEYCGVTRAAEARAWPELVPHPEDRDRCVAAWTAALRNGAPHEVEARYRRHDGVYRWFVTRAVPQRGASGQIVQWFGSSTDIDDRKNAEARTQFLADASAALADFTDQDSTLQKVASLAVASVADWCAVDLQGADGAARRLAHSHVDPAKVELAIRPSAPHGVGRVLRTGEPEWAASIPDELLAALANGEEHLRAIRSLGLRSYICVPLKSHGQVLGAITFVTAESGRTYGPGDVKAAEDLAHRAVIAIENVRLLASLKDADRRKDEFLALLSHELRNPLTPIRNAVQICRARAGPIAEVQWATDVIDRQSHHMTRMIDDLLDVSRITQGKIDLRKQAVDLATIVEGALESSRPLVEKWGHELTVTIPPRPIQLDGDPTRLTQVVSNLLNNAAKYTPHGGRIGLTAEQDGDQVAIRVKDDGIGIPADMLARVFEPFTQVGGTVESAAGGLGIGLTLVKRLTEMHGGSVEARSDGLGKGSEFVVRVPAPATPGRPAPKDAASGPLAAPSRFRLLVVDDNLDAADSLAMVLRMMGHEVETANDGVAAVGAAAAFHPDVILLDIGLPRMNGYEVARHIRQQDGGAAMILVALTGWGQEEDKERSHAAGFDHHITKPVDFEAMQMLMASIKANPLRLQPDPETAA